MVKAVTSDTPLEQMFLIPKEYKFLLGGIVYGQQPSMKNRNRIIRREGKLAIIHSKVAYSYQQAFEEYIKVKPEWKIGVGDKEHQLAIYVALYYKSFQSDSSIDLILDLLQKHGIIKNDRWVRQKFYWAGISKEMPRLHFRLYELPKDWLMPDFTLPIKEREK